MLTLPVNNFSKNTGPFHTKYDYLANEVKEVNLRVLKNCRIDVFL